MGQPASVLKICMMSSAMGHNTVTIMVFKDLETAKCAKVFFSFLTELVAPLALEVGQKLLLLSPLVAEGSILSGCQG